MRTRRICGVCFGELDGDEHVDLWPADVDYHDPRPILARVCEAGTCEVLADVLSNGRAYCSNHAITWALQDFVR